MVLNEFLEESEEPKKTKARETSPIPVRNKVGNGLKCKNSKSKKSKTTSSETATSSTAGGSSSSTSTSALGASEVSGDNNQHEISSRINPGNIWSNLTFQEDEDVSLGSLKEPSRKRPLLDLNLDDDPLSSGSVSGSASEKGGDTDESSGSGPSKRPKLDVMSAQVDVESHLNVAKKSSKGTSRSSSGSSTPTIKREDGRHKIQLSEDQLYGPFNFMDRRTKKHKQKMASSSSGLSGNEVKFKALREDLQMLIDSKETKKDVVPVSLGVPNKKAPSLVDLSSDASNSPPPVVDLSQSDNLEIRDLFQTLVSMFPTTCREYLEEQAEELCGKPIALERFISEHLARNSQPPDYWQPRIQTIKTEQLQQQDNSDSIGKATF